jgi:hypothetical protein
MISFGRVPLNDIAEEELRATVSFVSRDVYLFNTSIRDNIRLGRPDADDRHVMEAAAAAVIDEFINALPDGLDAVIGERGVRLTVNASGWPLPERSSPIRRCWFWTRPSRVSIRRPSRPFRRPSAACGWVAPP